MAERQNDNERRPGEAQPPPMTVAQFEAQLEFSRFKNVMRKLLAVPKAELDRRVQHAKKTSPRAGNPNAPGRKRRR